LNVSSNNRDLIDEEDVFGGTSGPVSKKRPTGALDDLIKEMGANDDVDLFGDANIAPKNQKIESNQNNKLGVENSKNTVSQREVTKVLDLM